jgi:ribosome assembly protein YihI (activator of Der GTPase)
VDKLLNALPDTHFDPVSQLDWEASIVWEEEALDRAESQLMRLGLVDTDNDKEEESGNKGARLHASGTYG